MTRRILSAVEDIEDATDTLATTLNATITAALEQGAHQRMTDAAMAVSVQLGVEHLDGLPVSPRLADLLARYDAAERAFLSSAAS